MLIGGVAMRLVVLALLVTGSGLFAQPRPNPGGFGSVLSPGTGAAPAGRPANPSGFGSVLSPGTGVPPGSRQGGPRTFVRPPAVSHPQHNRSTIVPYPVFYGGYYGGYDNTYAQ